MTGLMMQDRLTLDRILRRMRTLHHYKEVVTRRADHGIHRTTYGAIHERVLRLVDALRRLGVKPGDRVASFAWNSDRHLELYLAVPCMGAVLHTVNVRLAPAQIEYVLAHAEDRVLFVDRSLLACLPARTAMPTIEQIVVMEDRAPDAPPLPDGALDFDALLLAAEPRDDLPTLDEETAASLCYTSGTTGVLKGVLYSHRSIFLHSLNQCMADTLALGTNDSLLLVVPMFHVNAWGAPYSACLVGAKLVLPGPNVLGPPVAELIESEGVTVSIGVPSVWYLLHRTLSSGKYDVSRFARVLSGGSAVPIALVEDYARDFGVDVLQAWGMTETSPMGTLNRLQAFMHEWSPERIARQRSKQGPPVSLLEMKIVDDDGHELPRDGQTIGELVVRGPWVAREYFRTDDKSSHTADGWLRTGDVATIDEYGWMAIADRKKDLIKTRGEWLSSVELENAAMGHAAVLEAAVVGKPDPVRGEAVVLFVVRQANHDVDASELVGYLRERFQSWQVPKSSDIHFLERLPKTSVGKIDKRALRELASQ